MTSIEAAPTSCGSEHASSNDEIEISQVVIGNLSPRRVSPQHVAVLRQVDEQSLPPIVVHAETMELVDGAHRLAAAKQNGRTTIRAVMFHGSYTEATIEAIRLNSSHGRPLTLTERKRAAERILALQPDCSDRSISEICALAPSTIGALRKKQPEANRQLRVGRDGRRRNMKPTNPSAEEPTKQSANPKWWEADRALTQRCPALVETLSRTEFSHHDFITLAADFPESRRYQLTDELQRRVNELTRIISALVTGSHHP